MRKVLHQYRSSEGQHVLIPEVEAVAHMIRPHTALHSHEPPDDPNRSRFLHRTEWGLACVFPCRDEYVALLALIDQRRKSLKVLIWLPKWAESERFETLPSSLQNIDALDVFVAVKVADQKRDEPARESQDHIPVFPLWNMRAAAIFLSVC